MVPGVGLEPTRPCGQRILSPLRLPISPSGLTGSVFIVRAGTHGPFVPGRGLAVRTGTKEG